MRANHPAAGKAGFASRLAIGYHWPGLPEPGRWVFMKYRMCRSLLPYWCLLAIGAGAVKGEDQSADGPIYAGKPLSAWVDQVVPLSPAKLVNTNRAEVQAVRAIGTNAIAWLLSEMRNQARRDGRDDPTNFHQFRATAGFWALGERGAAAIPSLLDLLEQQPEWVASALAGIGAPALPALERCLTNAPRYVPPYLLSQIPRVRAVARALGGLSVAINVGRIPKSNAASLLPAVRLWAKDTNTEAAYWANGVLWELGDEP